MIKNYTQTFPSSCSYTLVPQTVKIKQKYIYRPFCKASVLSWSLF